MERWIVSHEADILFWTMIVLAFVRGTPPNP